MGSIGTAAPALAAPVFKLDVDLIGSYNAALGISKNAFIAQVIPIQRVSHPRTVGRHNYSSRLAPSNSRSLRSLRSLGAIRVLRDVVLFGRQLSVEIPEECSQEWDGSRQDCYG
jgi:hypothetical protein